LDQQLLSKEWQRVGNFGGRAEEEMPKRGWDQVSISQQWLGILK